MRTIETATITATTLEDGRFRQVVEHAPLPGITPAMCLWFLERAGEVLTWRGHTALGYRFWHPRDHISFSRLGAFAPGDRWHITEAFGADRTFLLTGVFHLTRLDETGFTMELRRAGRTVAVMDERWELAPAGMRWTADLTAGATAPGLRTLAAHVVRHRMEFLTRWRQHNVEEAGNLPHFLPEMYAERSGPC